MEQKNSLRMIYKINTKMLKKAKWDLTLPLSEAIDKYPECVVSISNSQAIRFIDEINGNTDVNSDISEIKRRIRVEKKKEQSRETRATIRNLYSNLHDLQFMPDYISIVMNSEKDYDRANMGFSVNGIKYRRFLGTNGGIKTSTIVYVSERIYTALKKKLDNGRNKNKEIVPAKLESYQALICSGSIPLPKPKGIIVVNDCITHFKDDVITIDDENDGEPEMQYVKGYEIEHNDSDGYGLMTPEYATRVNKYLNGYDTPLSGMNTRYAWTKGMVYTFDIIAFARDIAGTYMIKDVWGDWRDVRDADVILTESMLKLWDSYDNWEDYYKNCEENHYEFSAAKTTPEQLESVRDTNYQFLQDFEFTDDELYELCRPTIDEIRDVLGMDYRKSIVFLAGYGLNERNVMNGQYDNCVKALMADRRMINDPYIRKRIYSMIKKRINDAKKGSIRVSANFAMISGDPYALMQSMFGLKVTGLLKSGEIYHKYWIDRGATELSCFRAPMTCHNNVRKLKLRNDEQTSYWYRYIKTAAILNAWDTTCEAMNGSDKDGDTNMDTDNPVILKKTKNSPTVICMQRKASKIVPTEEDIIKANKLGFNDEIGIVTNHVTSMIELQSSFPKDSKEWNALRYRIICGQNFQQNTIDRIKGIIAKPMPDYWYNYHANKISDEDTEDVRKQKEFNMKIVADRKPYFMIYVYPDLKSKVDKYESATVAKMKREFSKYRFNTIDDLRNYPEKTKKMKDFLYFYENGKIVGESPCVINRICWIFENEFPSFYKLQTKADEFDPSILKSNVSYSKVDYNSVKLLYSEYRRDIEQLQSESHKGKKNRDYFSVESQKLADRFKEKCEMICTNENELCDIVVDLCYTSDKNKRFAWDICGDTMIRNLLRNNDNTICYPEKVDTDGDFTYCGMNFKMKTYKVKDGAF